MQSHFVVLAHILKRKQTLVDIPTPLGVLRPYQTIIDARCTPSRLIHSSSYSSFLAPVSDTLHVWGTHRTEEPDVLPQVFSALRAYVLSRSRLLGLLVLVLSLAPVAVNLVSSECTLTRTNRR